MQIEENVVWKLEPFDLPDGFLLGSIDHDGSVRRRPLAVADLTDEQIHDIATQYCAELQAKRDKCRPQAATA